MSGGNKSGVSRILDRPDVNVFIFAFLINYPWENLQAPLFAGMKAAAHWNAVKACTQASLGDATIMLLAYLGVAGAKRDRWWFRSPSSGPLIGFVGIGVIITFLTEYLATTSVNPNWGWRYANSMPVLPLIGLGLTPLLQWLLLPPIAIWFVRRQLAAADPDHSRSLPPEMAAPSGGSP